MDFKDQIKQLSERILKLKDSIQTEEATKNAFIMPFIQNLGYDVFNPFEVVPEYTCDIGTKKGEKIDYAILKDNSPMILIECKHWAQDLNLHDNQLLRYFNVSNAKFGLLTNGIIYRFYTDIDKKNIMDEFPFLEIDLTDIRDSQIEELKKFHKSYFDIDKILDTATDLKYTSEIKNLLKEEFFNPSEQFTRIFAKQVYSGLLNQRMLDYFTNLVKRSANSLINDEINERLKTALNTKPEVTTEEKVVSVAKTDELINTPKTELTEEELEGFYTIKTTLISHIEPERVLYKDAMSYLAINIDNTKKPLCRLYFNGKQKYIALFDENKKEIKYPVEKVLDVLQYKDLLAERLETLK